MVQLILLIQSNVYFRNTMNEERHLVLVIRKS